MPSRRASGIPPAGRQFGEPDPPAGERAFQDPPADPADGRQGARPDRGQQFGGLADRQQGAEGRVARLGQVGERGPGEPFHIDRSRHLRTGRSRRRRRAARRRSTARRGSTARRRRAGHLRTPSHRPSAAWQSSRAGHGAQARSAMVQATRMTLTTPRAVIRPCSSERSSTASEPGAGGQVRRSSDPGTSPLSRHGVSRSPAGRPLPGLGHPQRHGPARLGEALVAQQFPAADRLELDLHVNPVEGRTAGEQAQVPAAGDRAAAAALPGARHPRARARVRGQGPA